MGRVWKITGSAAVTLVLLAGGLIARGLAEAVESPVERRATFILPDWHGDAQPMRVALLADIHLGNRAMTSARLRSVVAQVNQTHPDLVLIAGDFVTGHGPVGAVDRAKELKAPLSALHARFGVIATLGNHDYWTDPNAIRRSLEGAGVTVLENAVVNLGSLVVIGVGDEFSGHDDLAKAMASAAKLNGYRIILTHTPDLARELPPAPAVVLAGHTHCGQVVLPGWGPVLSRSPFDHWKRLYDPHFRCGLIREGAWDVVVTAGLGSGSSPIRIGAPPDWWLITLKGVQSPHKNMP